MIENIKVYRPYLADRDLLIKIVRNVRCSQLREYDEDSLIRDYELTKLSHSFVFNRLGEPESEPNPEPFTLTFEEYKKKRLDIKYNGLRTMYESISSWSNEKLNSYFFETSYSTAQALHKGKLYKAIPELSDPEGGLWVGHRVTDSYLKVLALCNKYYITLSVVDRNKIKSWLDQGYLIHVDRG